ncbi:NAD-P-binding protein [Laetiporus sulphureus 93-53]|uniref:NAD-P-binding protein n=1 Tax=Laetiporus sulphureus 93-53 TaxID=1314785 RepID=A0A165C189_9APHY|nr:NAD-P-binding protein [Laetiporus sulphureus 93-53]KZT02016.1 NAD-P-binding protein [Laetiporus sulphureus 93-53]
MSTATKYVLITGCSKGGIGHALAREFLSRGYTVFATARQLESIDDLGELGAITRRLDVTDHQAVCKLRDEVASITGGKLEVLVNNARVVSLYAFRPLVPAIDMPMADARALFEVNFFAPMSMVQEFVQMLIGSGDGRILMISSVGSVMPLPFCSVYNASKAALTQFSNSLRLELAPFNVKVVTVLSGSVKTNIVKPHTLPEHSIYQSMENIYQQRRVKPIMEGAMPADQYARTVVSETLKSNPPKIVWAGTHTWFCWIVDKFLGQRGFDFIFTRMFGLADFAAMVKSGRAKAP